MPLPNETIIQKHLPNSFWDTHLNEYLASKEIKQLVICGMMSHMCIDTTVRAAFDKGYVCMVAPDACSTRKLVFNGIDVPADHAPQFTVFPHSAAFILHICCTSLSSFVRKRYDVDSRVMFLVTTSVVAHR